MKTAAELRALSEENARILEQVRLNGLIASIPTKIPTGIEAAAANGDKRASVKLNQGEFNLALKCKEAFALLGYQYTYEAITRTVTLDWS